MAVPQTSYKIICIKRMSKPHATFIRIEPSNLQVTLGEIYTSLANLNWVNALPNVPDVIRRSYERRAQNTLPKLYKLLVKEASCAIVSDAKQYVVSELARGTVVNDLGYLDIPLAELLRIQKSGNPGFDFYSENKNRNVLFGEAKYIARQSAYNSAMGQIEDFIKEGKDDMDVADLLLFCSTEALNNMGKDEKGFVAAFSATGISNEDLERNIENNAHFKNLLKYKELICVAVNI